MSRIAIILSGRFISPSMQSELGSLPPVFLSVAGKTLLEHQVATIEAAGGADTILLSLPSSYDPSLWQAEIVDRLGLRVIHTPEAFSIGEAVLFMLAATKNTSGGLRILYGDTMIAGVDMEEDDLVVVGQPPDAGHWAILSDVETTGRTGRETKLVTRFTDDLDQKVMAGYASFSSIPNLMQAIALEHYDFVAAIGRYDSEIELTFAPRGTWYDFGRPRTFFESRRDFTTERYFNNLKISETTVAKTSAQTKKVSAEAAWFESIPPRLRKYTPAFLGRIEENERGEAGYLLEYLHMLPLNDCFTHFRLPSGSWRDAVQACIAFLAECRQLQDASVGDPEDLYGKKTYERLATFCRQRDIDPDRSWTINDRVVGSFREIVDRALAKIGPTEMTCIVHGDFCFSNILFDTRTGRIRVIDPRGAIDIEQPSIMGDPRYDIAKLHHSFSGFYDLILAGRGTLQERAPYDVLFDVEVTDEQREVSAMFRDALASDGFADLEVVHAITVLLFVSMTPLHVDKPERQMHLAMNALRLALEL
uniref:phosphotransferase n=1 Tax=Roseovarius indicus TaxID=540747 RepID=UPI003B51C853